MVKTLPTAFIMALILFGVFTIFGAAPRTGDGNDYFLAMLNWGESLGPSTTDKSWNVYSALAANDTVRGLLPLPRSTEPLHFWLLGFLASLFYRLTKGLGVNPGFAFTWLNWTLLSACFFVVRRFDGWAGTISLGLLWAGSPILWFSNKAQVELFTFALAVMALCLARHRRFLPAAACLAICGTQNPPFSLLAVGLVAYWALRVAKTERRWVSVAWLSAIVGLFVLRPLFYKYRWGSYDPFLSAGFCTVAHVSLRRMLSFWIDPDIGLFPHWPFGLLLLGIYFLEFRRRMGAGCALMIGVLVLLTFSSATTWNINHGGTVDVSRYATWYLVAFYPVILALVQRWQSFAHPVIAVVIAAVAMIVCWNGFRPSISEDFVTATPLSKWLTAHFPRFYEQVPDIFRDRFGQQTVAPEQPDPFAVSDPSCHKILIYARQPIAALPAGLSYGVKGCGPALDGKKVLAELANLPHSERIDGYYYVYPSDADLFRLRRN